jgi:hypothetical protein
MAGDDLHSRAERCRAADKMSGITREVTKEKRPKSTDGKRVSLSAVL